MDNAAHRSPRPEGAKNWFQPKHPQPAVSRHTISSVAGFLVAGTLVMYGQREIAIGQYQADGVSFMVAGVVLLLFILLRGPGPLAKSLLADYADQRSGHNPVPLEIDSTETRSCPGWLHRPLMAILTVATLVAFSQSGGGLFRPLGVAAWILALCSFLLAFGDFSWLRLPSFRQIIADIQAGLRVNMSWGLTTFLAIWLLGCFLLFYRLPDVPEEMISDHAEKLLDVKDVLNGQTKLFFERNTGREALQFYISALLADAGLGLSFMTLKTGTVLIGVFSIPAIFVLTRVWFGLPIALTAAFFLAVSRWHLTVSRAGLRFTFLPVLAALTCFFLLRSMRYRRRNDFLFMGLVIGVGMHTYTPFRIIPLAVMTCLGIELIRDITSRPDGWDRARQTFVNSLLTAAVALLVFLPLGRFALERPDLFWYRGVTRLTSAEQPLPGHPLVIFLDNVKNASLMFNYRGDRIWNSNVPRDRVFDYVTGACFALGLVYALNRLVVYHEGIYGYLFIILFVALLPSTLSLAFPQENPSTVRSGMALPIAVMIAALPVGVLFTAVRSVLSRRTGAVVLALIILPLGLQTLQLNFQRYFVDFARSQKLASQNSLEVAHVINGFAASSGLKQHAWLKAWPHWVDTRLVGLQIGQPLWGNSVETINTVRGHDADKVSRLYVVHIDDHEAQKALSSWYPQAAVRDHLSPVSGDVLFRTYLIPGGL